MTQIDKHYNHLRCEGQIYQLWEKADAFNPDSRDSAQVKGKSFTIIMPPPNANDPLHVGHAMFVTVEDILIRYHRMLGDDTLWLPGTDHAGIETQFVFEKKLQKEKQSRFDFDRETLFQKIWQYVQENSDTAISQMKRLGASADWSRFKFTLDEDVVAGVLKTFQNLANKGLIYRANKLVNYCTHCGTGFSELEINHQNQQSTLYYIKYGPLTIATTRPETKFADVALAVHPNDSRYKSYLNQVIDVPGLFKTYSLPVIADEFVDPKFGTGVVKITPYHDQNDFDFFQRHKNNPLLKDIQPKATIDYEGRLTELAGPYHGLTIFSGRKKIVEDLQKQGLLERVDESYQNNQTVCYRCNRTIEPLPLTQFYIKTEPLIQPIIEALDNKKLKVIGAGHDKILRHWLEILKDWNISRQIVWGIRMPVWYNSKSNPNIRVTFLDKNKEKQTGLLEELLKKYDLSEIKLGLQTLLAPEDSEYEINLSEPSTDHIQETDTFDTWFSSSQWPVTTLQNNKPGDFERFYPTQVMETGYDILMFWVMRMLMMGHFLTNKLPFNTVYLHGLIRDAKGQKMSKSKGNVVNPMDVAEKYGADALRMALVIRSSAGLDKSIGEPDFKAARNLTNKLWNAARFSLLMLENNDASSNQKLPQDEKFAQELAGVIKEITDQLERLQIGLAAETLYNRFWHWFCDECIEKCKDKKISAAKLLDGLIVFLKLFHPFMPFITEQLWQELVKKELVEEQLLINSGWPKS
ncbi:MAG: Valine--tRNA ligase [Microgenomates bacterium 39_7]|nr:MAG: Valine--tRNA ligase [Microgenomates bacterium 39_7]